MMNQQCSRHLWIFGHWGRVGRRENFDPTPAQVLNPTTFYFHAQTKKIFLWTLTFPFSGEGVPPWSGASHHHQTARFKNLMSWMLDVFFNHFQMFSPYLLYCFCKFSFNVAMLHLRFCSSNISTFVLTVQLRLRIQVRYWAVDWLLSSAL